MKVAPFIPIEEALALSRGNSQGDSLAYESDNRTFVAHRDDLEKMARMGLADLPMDAIAIPDDSPLLATERTRLSERQDFSRRLSAHFPVYFVAALYELQSLMTRFDMKGYVIGGITRDLLLMTERRLEVSDVDITVEGNGLFLAEYLEENSRNFKVIELYPEFGTAKLNYKDSVIFDIASTRQEIYPHCGALPVVVNRGVPLVDDVIRRDFTINALALSIHNLGEVLDYSNGIRDIRNHEIRVLHPVSFFEDPSRILRALKFCARFDFKLSEETHRLLENFLRYAPAGYKGGGDRIKQELKSLLGVWETPAKSERVGFFLRRGCYRLLNMESGWQPSDTLIEHICKASPLVEALKNALYAYIDPDFQFDTYMCMLLSEPTEEEFQKTAQRLGLTRSEREVVEIYRKLKASCQARFGVLHEFSSPVEIYDLFTGLPLVSVAASLVDIGLADPQLFRNVLEAFLVFKRKWEKLQLELDGNDLIDLGVPEGKEVGRLLDEMLHVKLAGRLPERINEIEYVQNHLKSQEPEGDAAPSG